MPITMNNFQKKRGFTLVELMVAVGLFAVAMTLASGAYIMMISFTRQAQGTAGGIDNLSFALETMTRTIRTGTNYNNGTDCPSGCHDFSVDVRGVRIPYALSNGVITQNSVPLTDPLTITVTELTFYVSGAQPLSLGDVQQPYVTIVIAGTVSNPGKPPQSFAVETGAVMRKTDL